MIHVSGEIHEVLTKVNSVCYVDTSILIIGGVEYSHPFVVVSLLFIDLPRFYVQIEFTGGN